MSDILQQPGLPITSYRDLDVWRFSMDLAEAAHVLVRDFPREERFGLAAQIRRASASIPAQIAEGHQHSTRAYRHYLTIALGSQAECETHLELARRLQCAPAERIEPVAELAARVGRMLHGLLRSLPRT